MRTTRALAIAAILGIACSFRASANVVYDSETTNEWFSVNMSTLTTEALQTSPWAPPSADGEAKVESAVIKLDTDLGDPLTYTAVASEDVAIVAAEMTATVNASEPEFSSVPQAALCVIGTETATNWVGLVGTTENDAGYKWVTFSAPVPVAGETYSVRIEFDQRQGLPRQIRYRVGDTVLGDGWYPNPQKAVAANIASVSFSGTGDISGLGGSNVVANAATFNGIGYLTFDDALDAAKESGKWADGNPIVLYKNAEYTATGTETLYVNPNDKTFTINGSVVTKRSGNTYMVTAQTDCEAYIGSTYYVTFDEAVTAAGASDVIVVNKLLEKSLTVEKSYSLNPNDKLSCATLTVNAGQTLTLAGGLAVTTATVNGSVAGDALTVNGTLIGVNVAKLTFGDNATFAYGNAPIASATTLSLGNRLTITGLDDADIGTVVIDNAAVAGATLSMFDATVKEGTELAIDDNQLKIVKATPDIEIKIDKDTAGFDFTNGTINVNTTVKSGKSGTLTLTVYDFNGTVRDQVSQGVSASGKVAFDLDDLTAGGTYSYTIAVSDGSKDLGTAYGEFTAANWGDVWFGADASKGEGQRVIGGKWATEPTIENNAYYVIEDDSVFNVDAVKQDQGSNRVTRVDTKVTFESLVDGEVDVPEGDVIGGFVATTDGWKALTADDGWVLLMGAPAPVAGTPYVVRAEVDFISATKRVRYLVSEDDGKTFIQLSNGAAQWIDLAATTKSLLAQVELQGSGKVAKFEATVADKAVAKVDGIEYDSMEDALKAAKDNAEKAITLLTNATIEPKEKGKYEIAPGDYYYVSGGKVSGGKVSGGNRTIIIDETGKPPVVRPTDTEMKKVTTPDGNSYKNYDSLRKFLEKNKVEGYTKDDANAESVSAAMNAQDEANKLQLWQDYALGIDVGTSVAPVTTPAGDTDEDNITLAIPAVVAATPSEDYVIKYQVTDGTTSVEQEGPGNILIPLENGTGTYTIKAVFDPAQ